VKTDLEGKEMSDEDLAELEADTRTDMEVEPTEPIEGAESVDDDLPEGITEPEDEASPAEPEVDPEVERLKKLGLYRPGLIDDWDDLAKSYKHLEAEFSRRPVVEKPTQPAYDPQAEIEALQEELQVNPVAAIAKIANAMQEGNRQEINQLKESLFYGSRPEANDFRSEIAEIQREFPGLGIQAAFDMAKGRNVDKVVEMATQKEKRRATERQVALREKPGGVRTTPVDADKAIAAAAAGGGSAQEKIDRMIKVLESQNMGATD